MKLLKHSILILVVVLFVSSCSKKNDPDPQPNTPPAGAMSVTSISPDYGKAGTEITITGTKFSATATDNTVTLGGKAASVTSATSTQLKITAPADATHGTIEVKVGSSVATSAMFHYEPIVSSLNATSGKAGDVIVITGQHFGTTVSDFEVKINGLLAEITAATATTLSVKIPAGATTGLVTIARKTKPAVNGPNFTVGGGAGGGAEGFTILNGSVTITKLVANDQYGYIICTAIDETRNLAYAATKDEVIKIDLSTNAVTSIIKNSDFINIPYGEPKAIDVDANGKVYVLASMYGTLPTSGSNIFVIDPVAKTAKVAGSRFVGVMLNNQFGLGAVLQVMGNGEIIAIDQSSKELCKFSPDLSVRTVIYTLPIALENFVQLIKVNATTVRIVLTGISEKYYYDYSGTLGPKTPYAAPSGYKMISQTIGGGSKYGVAGEAIVEASTQYGVPRTTYTVGRLNTAQTAWEKKGSFIIESVWEANNIKYYNFIGLNAITYFFADKNGNMYAHILGNDKAARGIYKISLN